jgi:thymidylate synthase (FAD)
MSVKLISWTTNANAETLTEIVAYVARVSNPNNQDNKTTSHKLLNYLKEHKHWSPFEMVNVCMEINTTRDIARQILRHRSFTFQEFSQRYAEPKELGDMFALREARLQDKKNRQNSIEIESDPNTQMNETLMNTIQEWQVKQNNVINSVKDAYEWAIENGLAKEQARVVLPEGLTKSRMYMNGTLRSWLHYIEIRVGKETQKEHRLIAKEASSIITDLLNSIKDKSNENTSVSHNL